MPKNDEVSIIDDIQADLLYRRRGEQGLLNDADSLLLRRYEAEQQRQQRSRRQPASTVTSALSRPVLREEDLHSVVDLRDNDRLSEMMRDPAYEPFWKQFDSQKPRKLTCKAKMISG